MAANSTNPLDAYRIRSFEEDDREAVGMLGNPVVDWWRAGAPEAWLHLVAEATGTGRIVGHLQVRDRSVPKPSRRLGQCHFSLSVSIEHRGKGVGGSLYDRLETFAQRRDAILLYCGYTESPNAPATRFLRKRGFEVLERFLPSFRDLVDFDPSAYQAALDRLARQGIVLTTYAFLGDTNDRRRRLYDLEEQAHAAQPFRAVEPYVATAFDQWEREFLKRDPATIYIAVASGERFVGVITSLEWGFTGTHPDWTGRGIATALKVSSMKDAKARGIARIETENQEDNMAMLAINRKLGFVFTDPEVACVKRFA